MLVSHQWYSIFVIEPALSDDAIVDVLEEGHLKVVKVDLPAEAVAVDLSLPDQLLARRLLRPRLARHVRDVLDLLDTTCQRRRCTQNAALTPGLGLLQRVSRWLRGRCETFVLQATTRRLTRQPGRETA